MTGVEILAVEQIATKYAFNWCAWGLCAGVSMVFCVIVGIVTGFSYYSKWRDFFDKCVYWFGLWWYYWSITWFYNQAH